MKSSTNTVHPLVKVFVAWHIVCIVIWTLPNAPKPLLEGKLAPRGSDYIILWNQRTLKAFPPVPGYLFVTGTWQFWDMFAPDPAQVDTWGDALVTRRDGSVETFQYPRIFSLGLVQKYLFERHRKFFERAHAEENPYLWPAFAQHIARERDSAINPPTKIVLRRHFQFIRRPDQPTQAPYNTYAYYEHVVDQADLERWRR